MREKRGISAVITTMVIIFLALASTSIVWGVIKTIVSSGTEQISLEGFATTLEIKKVLVEDDFLSVDVRRNPGGGDVTSLKFLFESDTDSQIIEEEVTFEALEQKNFVFYFGELSISNITRVSVIPVYESDGKGKLGNIADTFEFKKGTMFETLEGNFVNLGFKGAGRKEYSVSSQSGDAVKFAKVIVDPLDVLPGDNQTFTAYVSSSYNITEVMTRTQLDNELLILPLELQPDGSWSATWEVYDTHTIEYTTTFIAKDSIGNENSMTLTWTDSCQSVITHGTDSTISTSCSTGVGAVAGIDGGSLTIASDVTLTIDSSSVLIFNQGESLAITASGASIASTSGGSFGNGYLFYTDSDGDNYFASTTLTWSANPTASGKVRAKDASGTTDCDDTFASDLGNGCGLVNNQNTSVGCSTAGGTVYSSGNNGFCKFSSRATCPASAGWTQYNDWSTTTAKTCDGGVPLSNPFAETLSNRPLTVPCGANSCTTSSHIFMSRARETCTFQNEWEDFHCPRPPDGTCTASRTQIGCY